MSSKSVNYCTSKDLNISFRVKIASLEGSKQLLSDSTKITEPSKFMKLSNFNQNSDLFASVVVTLDNKPLTIPITTLYTPFKGSRKWNEWLNLPIRINQLPYESKLRIVIWEFDNCKKALFGEAEVDIFNLDTDSTLKRGVQKVRLRLPDSEDDKTERENGYKELDRIEPLIKKHENGEIIAIDWLDTMTFKKIDQINKFESNKSDFLLFIDFIRFDVPVVFQDFVYEPPQVPVYTVQADQLPLQQQQQRQQQQQPKISIGSESTLKIYDPDQYLTDPIEEKFRKLQRSHKDGPLDKEIKPTPKIRDELNHILNYSSVQKLSTYEKNLIWKFRYFLVNNKKGLNKLLKSVNFHDDNERTEALKLLHSWTEIDIEDALELLGPGFKNVAVRQYAVDRLKKASDSELELYLLQLVQALRYESFSSSTAKHKDNSETETESEFSIVEASSASSVINRQTLSPLAKFLVERGIQNERLGSFLYWYLNVEAEEKPKSVYKKILDYYLSNLKTHSLEKERDLVKALVKLCIKIKGLKESTPKKIETLRNLIDTKFKTLPNVKLPLDPSVTVCGVVTNECSVFKSSLSPLKITFRTVDGGKYPLMFKVGDDLRQDQLVIQIILLMNRLLINENVDLKLTPYKILATGPVAGAIQFIPNSTLASVLADYHGILPYLKHHHPDETQELGVCDWVIDNFVKSCAGYCVITYILGVGDRHLDNLLICPDGTFFHADFGYFLGRDPKPFPPLMKLPPQIIEAFGGANSLNYDKFRNYCFVAYSILRKNSNLILNLFELMRDSSIPDISIEPDRAVHKVKEKFCLDMSEEEAIIHFQNLINDSVNALLPIVIDRLHSMAQYWRA